MLKQLSNYLLLIIVRLGLIIILCHFSSGLVAQPNDSTWIVTNSGCKVYNPKPIRNESITWSGECVEGFASGYGELIWFAKGKKGNSYLGEMRRGIPNGFGQYRFESSYMKGNYRNGDLNGQGEHVNYYNNGNIYSKYVGDFHSDQYQGKGTKIYYSRQGDTTSIYIGDFFEDLYHGNGCLEYFALNYRSIYVGEFNRNEISGYGKKSYITGNQVEVYEGIFVNGYINGFGFKKMGRNVYKGNWIDEKQIGQGSIKFDTSLVYLGQLMDGDAHGIGHRFFIDGSQYYGEFKKNEPHGFGIQIWKDGAYYVGEYKNSLLDGLGYFNNMGVISAGRWLRGRLDESNEINFVELQLKKLYPAIYTVSKQKLLKGEY